MSIEAIIFIVLFVGIVVLIIWAISLGSLENEKEADKKDVEIFSTVDKKQDEIKKKFDDIRAARAANKLP
jgi:hypothetical protein